MFPTINVQPLSFQSKDFDLQQWITLLTLCLAPVVAHIAAGSPYPTYLHKSRPSWHDRMCHYNPTSIIWRYAAIADRRVRAKSWDKSIMAASNAIFWTDKKWNGRESIAIRTTCVRPPDHKRVEIMSWEMINTIITTAQGVQAIYALTDGIVTHDNPDKESFRVFMGVDTIFFPIAVIGLLRLVAALWLTSDYAYTETGDESDPSSAEDKNTNDVFRSTSDWRSQLFRLGFIAIMLGFWVLCLLYEVPWFGLTSSESTMTSFLVGLSYFLFLSIATFLYGIYFFSGGPPSTLIPCISSIWYKLYTILVALCMVSLIIIATIETRITSCGTYTSASKYSGLSDGCLNSTSAVFYPT